MDVLAGLSHAMFHSWAFPHAVSEAPPGPDPPPPTPAARLINDDDAPPPAPLTTATAAKAEEPGESSKFYASVQSRIDSRVEADAVTRKPAQWAMEVELHQCRLHRVQGGRQPPGAQAVSQDLINNIHFKCVNAAK